MIDDTIKPADRLVIELGDSPKTIFMSAGLLRILSGMVALQDDLTIIFLDPVFQEQCLLQVLAERDDMGFPIEDLSKISLAKYPLTVAESDKLIQWIGEHILYFFTVSASAVSQKVPETLKKIQDLTQSLTGSENSAT